MDNEMITIQLSQPCTPRMSNAGKHAMVGIGQFVTFAFIIAPWQPKQLDFHSYNTPPYMITSKA